MKILIISRNDLISRLTEEYYANNNFITIKCKAEEKHVIWQNGPNSLKLTFDDISAPLEGCTLFDEKHARRISEFIARIDPSRMLIVNCRAGVSRSGAVGQVLDEYLNRGKEPNEEDHRFFVEHNPHITPNRHISNVLRKELGIRGSRAVRKKKARSLLASS
jgi:predicted protein tyrosine phosphatase